MYNLLAENYKEDHAKLVGIILNAANAEKIYLLGSTLIKRRIESVFMPAAPCVNKVSHYYILALVGSDDNLNTVQDKIENNCQHFIPVTAFVFHTYQFNELLTLGNPFALTVRNTAVLLHGEAEKGFAHSETPGDEFMKANYESIFTRRLNKVTEFIAGADLYRIRKQNKMAVFMLHQAAEHALHTLLKITTGLHFNTHNIDKFIRYSSIVYHKLPDIFPRSNEREERLFQLLQRAYNDCRYKDDYFIDASDLQYITERVTELRQLLQEVYTINQERRQNS